MTKTASLQPRRMMVVVMAAITAFRSVSLVYDSTRPDAAAAALFHHVSFRQHALDNQQVDHQQEYVHDSPSNNHQSGWSCLQTCCWRKLPLAAWPYQGDVPRNPTGMELAHTDSFKALSDITVFNLVDPVERQSLFQGQQVTPLDNQTAPCLQPSTVIYVQQHWFHHFATSILPLIRTQFILVTHDGDVVFPASDKQARALLDDDRLIHWFAMSCQSDHPKLTCLPLGPSLWKMNDGVPNYNLLAEVMATGSHGLVQGIYSSALHPKPANKQMLVNFNLGNHASRAPLWRITCNSSDAPLRNMGTCLGLDYGRSMKDFFKQVAEHRFVLSPRGAGPDAYRTWETLLLGSYPIVHDVGLSHLYTGLPVLVLKDPIAQISQRLLDEAYKKLSMCSWEYRTLYIGYWYKKVYHRRHGHSKQYKYEYCYSTDMLPSQS